MEYSSSPRIVVNRLSRLFEEAMFERGIRDVTFLCRSLLESHFPSVIARDVFEYCIIAVMPDIYSRIASPLLGGSTRKALGDRSII